MGYAYLLYLNDGTEGRGVYRCKKTATTPGESGFSGNVICLVLRDHY
jgi:hypothetical protein